MWTSAETAQEFLRVNAFDLGGHLGQRGSGAIIPRLAPDGKLPSRALLPFQRLDRDRKPQPASLSPVFIGLERYLFDESYGFGGKRLGCLQ
jgi:hypothetical protein